ncbi:class A beta-lactamase-related serine hydrolase [Kitasatospora sp. RB6PN24]|uniref:serine hydrolase n=1 Tax=Kitasatospora humi TaxID=2893891 RepID=UPI001E3BB9C5|nr:serine hydrolase [Kitasatospora humi]MCC9307902.1 class A beta-lactamase-related serine hydrolase [Kitasatospora humi]
MLSVVVAPWRRDPVVLRNERVPHEAASTMKMAVLAALYRGGLDWEQPVPVINSFRSAAGGEYANTRDWDSDPLPWQHLGERVPLRWLAERMVTHSSNLATNLCLGQVGAPAVAQVWHRAGAVGRTPRGIEDHAARQAGMHNRVSALDLVLLLESLEPEVLAMLEHNAHRVDLAAGLPPGTRLAGKNGWLPGARHSAAVVRPTDAPPYALAVCYTGPLANGEDVHDPAARLLARISAGVWQRRHAIAAAP